MSGLRPASVGGGAEVDDSAAVVVTVSPGSVVGGAVEDGAAVVGAASWTGADWAWSSSPRTMMRLLAEYRGWHDVRVRIELSVGASTSYCDGDTMNCSVTL